MAKTNSNRKKKGTKARKSPRAMALTTAEPRLRGPVPAALELGEAEPTSSSAKTLRPPQLYEMMLVWSPWMTMFRQQALLARAFLSMMEAQQRFAHLWSLSSHQAAQLDPR